MSTRDPHAVGPSIVREPHSAAPGPESGTASASDAPSNTGIFLLMALAAGLAASALYLAQPLLHRLSAEFDLMATQASWLVTGTQIGYAAGLLLLVPLGDVLRSSRLAVVLLLATALSLFAVTAAPSAPVLLGATTAASVGAVGAQVLVPMAAGMAPQGRSGRAVGTVMAGGRRCPGRCDRMAQRLLDHRNPSDPDRAAPGPSAPGRCGGTGPTDHGEVPGTAALTRRSPA
jgi:hypothetical protein